MIKSFHMKQQIWKFTEEELAVTRLGLNNGQLWEIPPSPNARFCSVNVVQKVKVWTQTCKSAISKLIWNKEVGVKRCWVGLL